MIDHLHIENFMTFEELDIPTLKRVNLIAGKNNSGKTSLLDAIRILQAECDSSVVNHILDSRNAFKQSRNESYKALYNRHCGSDELIINNLIIRREEDTSEYGFQFGDNGREYSLRSNTAIHPPDDTVVHVPFHSGFDTLNSLWENIVLTPKEDDVYEIIRDTVEPDLVRFDVGNKMVRVRLKDTEKPVPLGTLGDGVYRILLIAMSLANAQDSILLIDELELGLHYSALEKLWGMIFKYAKKWNIQVFATTHSQDAIRTFHYVSSDAQYNDDAQYIRLQRGRTGKNEAIIFDGERLKDSLELKLEIR